MKIADLEITEGGGVEAVIEDVLDVSPVNIEADYEPAQPFKRATGKDPFGQEGLPATLTINRIYLAVTEDYQVELSISILKDVLEAAGVYAEIAEAIWNKNHNL